MSELNIRVGLVIASIYSAIYKRQYWQKNNITLAWTDNIRYFCIEKMPILAENKHTIWK